MKQFSPQSLAKLSTCDQRLQILFKAVVNHFDCVILEGHRDEATQNKAFAEKRSTKQWPNGEHNKTPSRAVDVAPYPIDWSDTQRFHYFAGVVMGIASQLGLKVRWGGDWDKDTEVKDETFRDLVHFEIQ